MKATANAGMRTKGLLYVALLLRGCVGRDHLELW
jgi:hypothetical protein